MWQSLNRAVDHDEISLVDHSSRKRQSRKIALKSPSRKMDRHRHNKNASGNVKLNAFAINEQPRVH